MMKYDDAHIFYKKAFEVARELNDAELMAAALARRGVTYIQQYTTSEALEYLNEAYRLIKDHSLPFLSGYILQALSEADAIVVLAGTRGNIKFLEGKIDTAVHLYQHSWAPVLICVGKFSMKVTENPQLIQREEVQMAVAAGRLQEHDIPTAIKSWDTGLGAVYMRDQAIQMRVPPCDSHRNRITSYQRKCRIYTQVSKTA